MGRRRRVFRFATIIDDVRRMCVVENGGMYKPQHTPMHATHNFLVSCTFSQHWRGNKWWSHKSCLFAWVRRYEHLIVIHDSQCLLIQPTSFIIVTICWGSMLKCVGLSCAILGRGPFDGPHHYDRLLWLWGFRCRCAILPHSPIQLSTKNLFISSVPYASSRQEWPS